MVKSEIQIWKSFGLFDINEDILNNRFIIEIEDSAKPLPNNLEIKVNDNWKKISSRKKLFDNQILYLEAIEENNITIVKTNIRNFKYTQAFNRNPNFYNLTKELNEYHLLSISTHCHLITRNKKLLFGIKKNQFNQISGFSGFPDAKDSVEIKGKKYLDIYTTIKKKLRPEIGDFAEAVSNIKALGIVYIDTCGLRGTDSDYLVYLDEIANNIQKRFRESSQFERELSIVDFEPKKIIEFIQNIYSQKKEMSKYALGCSYLIIKSFYGQEEANNLLKSIRELGITISTSNETDYLK